MPAIPSSLCSYFISFCSGLDLDGCHTGLEFSLCVRAAPEVCRGPGIDGFYPFGDWHCSDGSGLQVLAELGLLEVFGVEVLEERKGEVKDRL